MKDLTVVQFLTTGRREFHKYDEKTRKEFSKNSFLNGGMQSGGLEPRTTIADVDYVAID